MKKIYFLLIKEFSKVCLLSASLIFSATVYSQDITTGLKLHYDFESIEVTTVPDVSGNGNAGILQGTATVATGQSGLGVLLTTSKADYISVPAEITAGLTSFTYAAWVNIPELKNATRFFDFGTGIDATNNFLAFIPSFGSDNNFMCLRFRPATGTAYNVISTVKCPVGTWAHIALVFEWNEGTSMSKATIYLNGAVVGYGENLPYNPTSIGSTADNYFGYSRWNQDTNGFNGTFDDIRLYNRALTNDEVLVLKGTPSDLISAYNALTLGNTSEVTTDLTLPLTLGSNVTVSWSSSLPLVIENDGKVNRPELYDATVKLTATLTQTVGDVEHKLIKIFNATVKATNFVDDLLANWDFAPELITEDNGSFKVTSATETGFVGTIMNDARIRTIGVNEKINVLDLGNGTGYFDMGAEIGKAIYSLNDYTMCGYFRIDEDYPSINSNGNFYWTFSNTADAMVNQTGYIIGSLKNQSQSVSTNYYSIGNQAVGSNVNALLGGWHHIAYTQMGTTGTIYVDGQIAATGSITNLPSIALTREGLTGTLYNWLGRSNYVSDVYLRKTLLYGFQLLKTPLASDDINFGYGDFPGVSEMIDRLNVSYSENPDYVLPELTTEMENLSLGDLSAVTSNITLPTKGTDTSVSISWKSTNVKIIDNNGIVTRPNYYNYPDTLIATLSKSGQKVTKKFPAVVLAKEGSQFTNDLLVKFDFATVSDSVVTDAAEKHFSGVLKNNATIRSIGTSVKYNVLSLGDSIGYFDMGEEVGKLMYNLNDYTVGAYYRVDTAYTSINQNGNFLWNFSNSKDIVTTPTGYILGSLRNLASSITPTNWTPEQTVALGTPALPGNWHHFAYTQSGTTGTVYIDGIPMMTNDITSLPSTALPKAGQLGTLYNWIGRSCYVADVYLRNTLVYDFRLYKTALTDEQIQTSELNVGATISALEAAYDETPNSVKSIIHSPYKVISTVGSIKITGLAGGEKVSIFDIAGRQLKVTNPNHTVINSGIYIVRINGYVTKTIVK
jgi:hypothetical protein